MVALRTGGRAGPQPSVEEAAEQTLPAEHEGLAASMLSRWVVDDPVQAAARIRELATQFGVDEVMVNPIAGASAADPRDRAPAREATLELLAAALSD